MLIRIVRLTFALEHVPAFLRIFQDSEALIRQMPGCRYLELWQDADRLFVSARHRTAPQPIRAATG